ncbi:Ricin-type beta-trefoil lectin domain protein [Streptomyces sp. KY75]|nr:Ricin-type beta-trefoil lectin domain protein [Streptomyces sp. IB2014 011-1]CAD5968466.1 Ricin-type beta-trefoil lectin domain protein [Streptomyces sp. KY75]CAD5975321.1 Ricin-type beta-trefoil lectin domain protein [Streptomyces sp. KY70]
MVLQAMRAVVVSGAAVAVLGGVAAPAGAAPAPAGDDPYKNTGLTKVYGKTGLCFSMDNSKKSKTAVKLRGCNKKSTTQRWNLLWVNANKPAERPRYVIQNRKSGKCLAPTSKKSGATVRQYGCNKRSKTQWWTLSDRRITSYGGGKLVMSAQSDKKGKAITLMKYSNKTAKLKKQAFALMWKKNDPTGL